MTMDLKVIKCENCEELKLGVHAAALGIVAVCGAYNVAAWLSRRERHLVVNAVLYTALMVWEQQHVSHHMAEMRHPHPRAVPAAEPEQRPTPEPEPQPIAA